jgi:hypothetical protein
MIYYKLKESNMAVIYLQKAINSKLPFDGQQEANTTLGKIQDNNF